jgi:UDP-N-acetylmuramoylalanine--D-glutamate ligase
LQEAGKKVQLIGNIGNPVLEYLSQESLNEEEYVVFEVSSYMLEGLQKKNFLSILVNIYPDHLDWHQGFSNYLQAKLSLIKGSEHMLLRDEVAQKYPEAVNEQSKIFGHTGTYRYQSGIFYLNDQPLPPLPAISLQGEHNMMNICAVLGVCDSMDISYTHLRKVLTTFE